MRGLLALLPLSFIASAVCAPEPTLDDIVRRYTKRTKHGVHVPIVRQAGASLRKRGSVASIGLGDYQDFTYNVLLTVGGVAAPLVLDTGSSDLWIISDACTSGCSGDVPVYPQSTFQSVGLPLLLQYGDSQTGTYALGLIGKDSVDLAGLKLSDQYFGAVNNTNTTITNSGSAGIFGLGFPYISVIFGEIFNDHLLTRRSLDERELDDSASDTPEATSGPQLDLHTPTFPKLADTLKHLTKDTDFHIPAFPQQLADALKKASGKITRGVSTVASLLSQSYAEIGPLLSRLVATGALESPMFAVTLQRNTIDIGGNVGQLSVGELPSGVKNDSLTWVPVRLYPMSMTGIAGPEDSPDEEYPIAWEVFIDDVFLDGVRLPRSNLSSSTIELSALVDTGNSLIRGPEDVVQTIQSIIGSRFACNDPHTLAFQIGGKMFPVDPRDFIRQVYDHEVSTCASTVVSTDPPGNGYLFSWSLGMPFLKGVLSAYYYGNLSYPSHDIPRMGLLSTVPSDANQKLVAAVQSASKAGGEFPATFESAPSGTPIPERTNSDGVPEATMLAGSNNTNRNSGAERASEILALGMLPLGSFGRLLAVCVPYHDWLAADSISPVGGGAFRVYPADPFIGGEISNAQQKFFSFRPPIGC
ncbi:aspartic peptidase domain-containing protein [Cyathus striatus]|nr:aspartic peptidase domain-containing protein [Cyathus striatus]